MDCIFSSRASITSAGTSPGTWASFREASGHLSATSCHFSQHRVWTFLSTSFQSQLAKLLLKVFLLKGSMYASSCGIVHSTSNRWSLCLRRILKKELGSKNCRCWVHLQTTTSSFSLCLLPSLPSTKWNNCISRMYLLQLHLAWGKLLWLFASSLCFAFAFACAFLAISLALCTCLLSFLSWLNNN